jgi:hypothetical protein
MDISGASIELTSIEIMTNATGFFMTAQCSMYSQVHPVRLYMDGRAKEPTLRGGHSMRVVLTGATGMVGQGVLRECLLDPAVTGVLAIGRSSTGQQHQKLKEAIPKDPADLSSIADNLSGYDACFFCLGVSAAGMTEEAYKRITYDLTMSLAVPLARLNPEMTFVYVSGTGTDSTEKGRMMWARVKGATENALMRMPFKAAYMFRPGYIQPLHGVRTKTKWYAAFYAVMAPMFPVWKRLLPKYVTTTECIGRAMLKVARHAACRLNRDIDPSLVASQVVVPTGEIRQRVDQRWVFGQGQFPIRYRASDTAGMIQGEAIGNPGHGGFSPGSGPKNAVGLAGTAKFKNSALIVVRGPQVDGPADMPLS